MNNIPDTCAVIVTYNRKEKLKRCINCLNNQKGAQCDIYVIDNASTDGTEEMIFTEYNKANIFYFNTGMNLGGAGGFEVGIKKASQKNYKFIWIMDDDTWPKEDALSELIKADRKLDGNWGFLSSVAYWTDGSICKMNIQKKNIFKHIGRKEYNKNISKIKMCSFVSLLIKNVVVKEVGLPIGEYFIWTDDYEYTGRISKKYDCYMIPSSHVIHAMDKHTRVNIATDNDDRINRYKYIYRNDVHCYRQYGLAGWTYIVLKDFYSILNVLINSKDKRIYKVSLIIKGFWLGCKFHPLIKK